MRRIHPDFAELSIADALDALDPEALAHPDRPYLISNFVTTIDGHATIEGRSGPIGSAADTAMLMGLRARADAVMIGAGTLRVERYGRIVPDVELREERERRGLGTDPLAVIASASFELPWDAPIFTSGHGRVVILTESERDPPATETGVEVIRSPDGVDLPAALRTLRADYGVRLLLSEGGPHLHHDLLHDGLADELFLTLAPKLAGGGGPRIVEGPLASPIGLELVWLLEEGGELFARYRITGAD